MRILAKVRMLKDENPLGRRTQQAENANGSTQGCMFNRAIRTLRGLTDGRAVRCRDRPHLALSLRQPKISRVMI